MSLVVRIFIKTSLLYLIVALALGAMLMASSAVQLPFSTAAVSPVYIHLFVTGWITQLIFGVAWWMFPVVSRQALAESEWLMWMVYGCLNSGLLLRTWSEPALVTTGSVAARNMLGLSAALQAVAGVLFACILWSRVKAPKIRRPTDA